MSIDNEDWAGTDEFRDRIGSLLGAQVQSVTADLDEDGVTLHLHVRTYGLRIACRPSAEPDAPTVLKTPQQLRNEGVPYCPVCFTFGHLHSKTCPHRNSGMAHHIAKG